VIFPEKVDTTRVGFSMKPALNREVSNGGRKWKKEAVFDRDYKISAVKMVTEGGHKSAEVARSLGIHPNQLYNWNRSSAPGAIKPFPGKGI